MGKSFFRCRKVSLYRSCKNCCRLNGDCDYRAVFAYKDKPNYNPCPICINKNTIICVGCCYIRDFDLIGF